MSEPSNAIMSQDRPAQPATAPVNPRATDAVPLRRALGCYTTGVTIISCFDTRGQPQGLTANSFVALSLDPPLILWSLRLVSQSMAAFVQAPRFAVNVLAEGQVELSRRFASSVPDKFEEGVWSVGEFGAPVLTGCAAVFECELTDQQVAGDHRLFIGQVLACAETALPPLVFQGGHYHLLGEVL